jgi:hypothetical protein
MANIQDVWMRARSDPQKGTNKGTVAKLWVGSGVDGKVQALLHGRVGVLHVPVGHEFVPEHIV